MTDPPKEVCAFVFRTGNRCGEVEDHWVHDPQKWGSHPFSTVELHEPEDKRR
jgi:hypothetical protein